MAGGGVHHQAGGFVDYDDLIVFKNNIKGNIFGDEIGWLGRRHTQEHTFTSDKDVSAFFNGFAVYLHLAQLNQRLKASARMLG
jgi:hypothetical protein